MAKDKAHLRWPESQVPGILGILTCALTQTGVPGRNTRLLSEWLWVYEAYGLFRIVLSGIHRKVPFV